MLSDLSASLIWVADWSMLEVQEGQWEQLLVEVLLDITLHCFEYDTFCKPKISFNSRQNKKCMVLGFFGWIFKTAKSASSRTENDLWGYVK